MRILPIVFLLLAIWPHAMANPAPPAWARAETVRPFAFPADHFSHPESKTEWWYFTGNLSDAETGEPLGFQFTLFRQGLRPPGSPPADSRWISSHFGLGHAALSLPGEGAFLFDQVIERGSHGSAGFPVAGPIPVTSPALLARVGDWSVSLDAAGDFHIAASFKGVRLALVAKPMVAPVLQGNAGLSQKAEGTGNASYYYSIPRLQTTGTISWNGKSRPVRGLCWLDREWASNQLAPDQIGWDWFALQLDDGRDLMLYQMRRADGTRNPFSHGSLRAPDGTVSHLPASAFSLVPARTWKSPATGGIYPVEWLLRLPGHQLELRVTAAQDPQELALEPVPYYEGAVIVSGPGPAASGRGYMELTGYARPLDALRSR